MPIAPLPYTVDTDQIMNDETIAIEDADLCIVATVQPSFRDDVDLQADNALFLTKAANMHGELVSALRQLVNACMRHVGSPQPINAALSDAQAALDKLADPVAEAEDEDDATPECQHLICKHCGQDIEGFSPYPAGEWRDRGNNRTCPDGPQQGQPHVPFIL